LLALISTALIENEIFLLEKGSHEKLPPYLTLLLYAANKGDEASLEAVIVEFTPTINTLALKVQKEFELDEDEVIERLFEEGVMTLQMFMNRHTEKGFCNFIVMAMHSNIRATFFEYL
jgi:hypothetical protein